jgi:hypothetical protein
MATKVKAAVLNRAFAQYKKDTNKVQAFTNTVSRRLVESGSSKDMGRMGEYLVKAELEDLGYEVKLLSGIESCDLKVKVGQSWKRVEVKTARASLQSKSNTRKDGTRGKQFFFSSLKTQLFDMVVLVFVDYDRTVIKVGGKLAKKHIDFWGTKGNNGLGLRFGENMRQDKEYGKNVFLDLDKKNVRLSLKS